MPNIRRRPRARNKTIGHPDLFSFRQPILHPTNRAARKLAARFGLSIAYANTIAQLAGIGLDGEAS